MAQAGAFFTSSIVLVLVVVLVLDFFGCAQMQPGWCIRSPFSFNADRF